MIKVLFDTDIGTDIDDAVCLAYLLAQPACDLLGITTVTGESQKRAMLASALCKVAGKDVPIFPGAEQPLLVAQGQPVAAQATALERWDHDTKFPRGQAVQFLRDTIRRHPGEIVLLTVGPLTNIGLLFRLDPEIPRLLKGLVMMCGIFTSRVAGYGPREWNAFGDPHATAIVYRSAVRVHRSIGLDVTSIVTMSEDEIRQRFNTRLLRPALDMGAAWIEKYRGMTFHDPLAAATIFEDQLCTFERGTVEIELASERVAGMTHWTPEAAGPHEVALTVDRGRFFDHFFGVIEGAARGSAPER
jgi:purine nucleosidase